jgi:hypothetical protein
MHRARIAVLPALALALSACTRILPWDEDDGADVAETSDEYGTDSDSTGLLPDLPTETTETETTTSDSETGSTGSTDETGDPFGYCCTCVDGCWLSPSEVECVGFGEWHPADTCEFVPPASGDCDMECDPPPAACCTCPDPTTPEYEFQCWEWTQTSDACEVSLASTLNEPTHWCTLDAEGYPTACLDAC